jgi:cytochrome c
MFERKLLAAAAVLLLAACNAKEETTATQRTPGGSAQRGVAAIQKHGCGGCHIIPGIPHATGMMGPSLAGVADRMYVGGKAANQPDNLILWITDPQKIAPGTAMPDLNVSDSDARDIAAYLYTLRK